MNEEETEVSSVEELLSKSKEYFNTRIELFKLKAIDKASNMLSSAIIVILFTVSAVLGLIMISVGVSLYLGKLLGSNHYGFLIVGGFYIIAGLILFAFKKQIIKVPFSNWLIKNLLD